MPEQSGYLGWLTGTLIITSAIKSGRIYYLKSIEKVYLWLDAMAKLIFAVIINPQSLIL